MSDTGRSAANTRVPPGEVGWLRLGPGDLVDVVSPDGPQVADVWAFDAADATEHLSVAHCRLEWSRVRPIVGDHLVSNRRRELLRIVADTSGGVHDTLLPACDAERYARLGCVGHHRNCAENLEQALDEARLPRSAPEPLNLFENAVTDPAGGISIMPPVCPPGGHVRLQVLVQLVLVVSACPQDVVPTNGSDLRPKPIDLVVRRADHSAVGRELA